MRLIFMGTPEFAVSSLRGLDEAGHEVALVVTRPDAPRGRSGRPSPPEVKTAALELGLDVYQPQHLSGSEGRARLGEVGAEMGVVVAYGEILSRRVLAIPPRGFLNVHASLLPKYRGAAPVNWAVIRGARVTGVSVQQMVSRLDAGPVLAQREVEIARDETAGELHDRMGYVGAELIVEVVDSLAAGHDLPARDQDASQVSFAPKLTKQDGRVDWSLGAQELRDLVRGLTPWPGAGARLASGGSTWALTLLEVACVDAPSDAGLPGDVIAATPEGGIVVRAGSGAVAVRRLKPASGREMTAAAFLNGRPVAPGDRFE